jgi:hypothetical protein
MTTCGFTGTARNYEFDHLIPLEIGGYDDLRNGLELKIIIHRLINQLNADV